MKIAFFGLTGMGNIVLSALVSSGFAPAQIVTRKEAIPHPYYPVPHLCELADHLSLPCSTSDDYFSITEHCDVLIVATFHKVLERSFLDSFKFKCNIHPSILPLYRGPNPFYWVIRNQEKESGVSIHNLTEKPDQGPIFWQKVVSIDKDETQGSLRFKLSKIASQGIIEVLDQFIGDRLQTKQQSEGIATYFPNPRQTDFLIDFSQDAMYVSSQIRAVIPYPGFLCNGKIITNVQSNFLPPENSEPGTIVKKGTNFYLLATGTDLVFLTFDH